MVTGFGAAVLVSPRSAWGTRPKVAVTAWSALIVIEQAPVPVHAPDQPVKTDPGAAVAVRLTTIPRAKLAVQVAPQSIPTRLLLTVPVPAPTRVTLSVNVAGGVTVQAKLALPLSVPSEAVTVTAYGLLAAAPAATVPEIRLVLGLMLSPAGKPVALKVSGLPLGSLAAIGNEM